jgi:outer membrane receptor protein involved in Fe transport
LGRRKLEILAFAAALSLASNADARGLLGGARIVLKEGRLADALRDLSVRSGSDLLFAPDVVGNLHNKRIAGSLQVEPILARLLEGTGLSYRRVGNGVYIVFRPPPEQPTAVPELLVLGRKTQNADIRRSENDFQGYRVATSEDVRTSHADNLDQFLRSRQTSNAERLGPASDPRAEFAANRSEIDLHGLGPTQTLVLVDGTRMPGTVSQSYDMNVFQSDLNGLPLLAIDRIESLTGTAGGIYGPGATGGVVNVILKRDYRGAEVSATYGVTDRGDAMRRRVDGRIGFTPDGGATDIMINVSRSESDGLRVGDRDFALRALRQRIASNDADTYNPITNGVFVRSLNGDPLRLSAALGGVSLGATFTYLPLSGSGAGDGSVLVANAGKVPAGLSPDGNGVLRSLVSETTVTSLLVNMRHRFTDHVEATLDFIGWENEGRSVYGYDITGWQTGRRSGSGQGSALAAPNYPFGQPVALSFPTVGLDSQTRNRLRATRTSASLLFDLPKDWRGGATYAVGETRNRVRQDGWALDQNFYLSLILMQPGPNGEPAPNPFGAWDSFVAALQAYKVPHPIRFERRLRLQDATVRLGGPILRRDAGDVTLSLVAERREEKAKITPWDVAGQPDITPLADPSFSLVTASLYGELRAPIVSRASDLTLLRGLELQVAARHDKIRADIPGAVLGGPRTGYDRGVMVYTTGLRVYPSDSLMLRASLATGVLPPTPQQMAQVSYTYGLPNGATTSSTDPKRGGKRLGFEKPLVVLSGGSPRLRPEEARTTAAGFVVNPDGGHGPRLSVDYTHTEKRAEIGVFGGLDYLLAHEALYPGRIVRDPLTPADAAAGYTGGVITQADTTSINIGRTTVDAVDMHVDQGFRLGPDNRLRLYGGVTWTPRLKRKKTADDAEVEYTNTAEGPLRWRGAAGAAWQRGDLTVQLDGQYYGDYHAVFAAYASTKTARDLASSRVPAQVYLDAAATWRLPIGGRQGLARDIEIRFGVQNLLGHAPPLEGSTSLEYSFYGDPRGRRFELSATARF